MSVFFKLLVKTWHDPTKLKDMHLLDYTHLNLLMHSQSKWKESRIDGQFVKGLKAEIFY